MAKASQLESKENPRYAVSSLSAQEWPAQRLREDLYCKRGEMENRIKEQLSPSAGRVSAEAMRANQWRMDFAAMAYVLMHGPRRLGLKGTELERAQATTIRLRLLKHRGADPDYGAPGVAVDGFQFSAAEAVWAGVGGATLLKAARARAIKRK